MSLLDKASLIVTANAYKTSKLYSIVPNTTLGDMDVVRATTATRVNSAGLIESVAVNIPRIDYTNGSCPSLLVEPQRTNLNLYSEDFGNAYWTLFAATRTLNVANSPSGIQNADKLIEDNTNSFHSIYLSSNFIVTIGQAYTRTIYAKADGRNWISLLIVDGSQYRAFFDLQNGILGNITSGVTAKITNAGNGWYRCEITRIAATISLSSMAVELAISNGTGSYLGNGTSGVYLWGAQIELGAYATSYIPTVASTVTRNADIISKTGISSLIGQTEGTIYAEIKVNKLIGTASRYIFHISDGTVNNRIYIAFSGSSSNVIRGRIFNGGTLQCSIDSSTITTTGTYKLALAYKNNDIVFYINGVQIGVDTSATIPTCSRVDIGQNYAGASQLGDGILNANIFKTRLLNTELAQLTTL
jgi:hypothetical protein